MAECNETIVSLEHTKDIYHVEMELCIVLIDKYDKAARQLFNLAEAWDLFKNRRRITKPYNDTGSDAV